VLGISVDSSPANNAFAKQIGVTFPLLSDFNRKVTTEYGILIGDNFPAAKRTTFVVNKEGVITHIEQGNEAIDPTGAQNACSLLEHEKMEHSKQ
jgi:peroxiredoxin